MKKNLLLSMFFIILCLFAYYHKMNLNQLKTVEYENRKADFTEKDVNKITISSGEFVTDLIKKDQEFVVLQKKNYPASPSGITTFFRIIEDFNKLLVVSDNQSNHKDFKVSIEGENDGGTLVEIFGDSNKLLMSFIAGKWTPDYQGSFMRFKDENRVYRINQDLGNYMRFNPSDWLKQNVISVNIASIMTVEVNVDFASDKYTLIRKEDKWSIDLEDFNLDSKKVEKFVGKFATVFLSDIPELQEPKLTGLNSPSRTVKLYLDNGEFFLIEFGDFYKNNRYCFVRINNIPWILGFNRYSAENFAPLSLGLRKDKKIENPLNKTPDIRNISSQKISPIKPVEKNNISPEILEKIKKMEDELKERIKDEKRSEGNISEEVK